MLDSDYEEVYGYATPGFSIYAGVKLSLNDFDNLMAPFYFVF